ncbi:hypothetical protein ACO2Q8_25600 [Larkinella sp. VNQ87]|uniref:hypothetical protein n=1 Tax=Larkinella sp. VNQ87 TaxID=3400921 RepID=UPI003C0AF912
MNQSFSFTLLLALSLLLASCKHEQNLVTPDKPEIPAEKPQSRPGKVHPIGSPLGTATTQTIGPAGGQLSSADNRLTITVPAGAVETAQSFSIQPISSTGPQSLGNGFRLAPHGTSFKKPVTIRVQYDPATLSGTVAEALALAYQNDKGIWMLAANGKVDTVAHTVSVETTHFSDWAVLERAKLYPEVGFVKPGGDLTLTVQVLDDYALVPLTSETEVSEPYDSPTALIDTDTWKLAGSGKLVPLIWKAQYLAPNTIPARNPVAVSIKLKAPTSIDGKPFRELWLVSNIYIGDEGISFRINGGKWIHTLASARLLSNQGLGMVTITGGVTADGNNWGINFLTLPPMQETEETSPVTLINMTMPWTVSESGPHLHLTDQQGNVYYKQFYPVPPVFYPSPGALTYYHFGKVGDYLIGKFELEKAGRYNDTQGYLGTSRIEGFFRVKRLN